MLQLKNYWDLTKTTSVQTLALSCTLPWTSFLSFLNLARNRCSAVMVVVIVGASLKATLFQGNMDVICYNMNITPLKEVSWTLKRHWIFEIF